MSPMSLHRVRRLTPWILAGLLIAGCTWATILPTPAMPDRTPTVEASEGGVALTIYNQGTALVRDRRQFAFQPGVNDLDFSDVAALIDPTSVLFKSLSDPGGTEVLEQNYEFDLVGSAALLEKYLDETISVVTEDGKVHSGTLLSGRGDIILRTPAGEVSVIQAASVRELSFPELPDGLITRPTLAWKVLAEKAGRQDIEVTYLTGGMSWAADYVLLLDKDEGAIDLDGWISLSNTSGATFQDALLKLIAGDLQRLQELGYAADALEAEKAAMPTAAPVEQREFFEYHLYEIPRPVTVRDNESKQIEFVSAAGVPAGKFFVYDGLQCRQNYWYCTFQGYAQTDPSYGIASNPKVMVMVEFDTEEVDADLPRGRVSGDPVAGTAGWRWQPHGPEQSCLRRGARPQPRAERAVRPMPVIRPRLPPDPRRSVAARRARVAGTGRSDRQGDAGGRVPLGRREGGELEGLHALFSDGRLTGNPARSRRTRRAHRR